MLPQRRRRAHGTAGRREQWRRAPPHPKTAQPQGGAGTAHPPRHRHRADRWDAGLTTGASAALNASEGAKAAMASICVENEADKAGQRGPSG